MNEKVREPNKPNTEEQESHESSRSPGVTDRGLIRPENRSNTDNKKEANKDTDKSGDSVKLEETLDN